jgi:hypothetical protein
MSLAEYPSYTDNLPFNFCTIKLKDPSNNVCLIDYIIVFNIAILAFSSG